MPFPSLELTWLTIVSRGKPKRSETADLRKEFGSIAQAGLTLNDDLGVKKSGRKKRRRKPASKGKNVVPGKEAEEGEEGSDGMSSTTSYAVSSASIFIC